MSTARRVLSAAAASAAGTLVGGPVGVIGALAGQLGLGAEDDQPKELQRAKPVVAEEDAGSSSADDRPTDMAAEARRIRTAGRKSRSALRNDLAIGSGGSGVSIRGR